MNVTYGLGTLVGTDVIDDVRIGSAVVRGQSFGIPVDSDNMWDTDILGRQFGKEGRQPKTFQGILSIRDR